MKNFGQKELPYERILFFTDAIVAIAITLMAFNLKVEVRIDQHLLFADILAPWRSYLAFLLSFINIASFWRTHHLMFGFFLLLQRIIRLEDIEAIKTLTASYANCINQGWNGKKIDVKLI